MKNKKINQYLDKVMFNDFIEQKIKNESLKYYFKDFFSLKTILIKVITLVFTFLVCGLIFFITREKVLVNNNSDVVFNPGVAFSLLSKTSESVVYAIKIIISIVFSFIFIFTNKWYLYIPSSIVAANAWFNVIDKTIVDTWNGKEFHNTVVDYIHLNGSIANVADVFITTGIIALLIGIVVNVIISYKKDK